MKTNRFFFFFSIACGAVLAMSSCTGNEDSPVDTGTPKEPEPVIEIVNATIGFEGATLNADGIWCGDESGEKVENYGSEAYACLYKEDIVPRWQQLHGALHLR